MTEHLGHVDVLIVGAGLSGIGAAAHLEERLPGTSYLLLEARATRSPIAPTAPTHRLASPSR